LLKQSIFATVAILSIAASATADAKPRHNKQRAVHATVVCNDRGCSGHQLTARHTARVHQATVRTKVRFAHRHRAAGIKHAAVARPTTVRHAPLTAQANMVRKNRSELRSELRSEARQVRARRERVGPAIIVCNQQGCSDRVMPAQTTATAARAEAPRAYRAAGLSDANGNAIVIGGRPAGCPHRFCGCEASRYVFGEIRPELNLASNWIRKFPRTSPAPGMAAARSGHVMILISHAGGNDWLVHDGNSGGGLTRDHVMSINRYVIVDPRSSRSAQR
jgi:hypothetical protein